MRHVIRFTPIIIIIIFAIAGLEAAGDKACLPKALAMLRSSDPNGYAVYEKVGDESFSMWLDCKSSTYGLSMAVHESVHMIDTSKSGWSGHNIYLPGGETVTFPRKNLFPRSEIARYLKAPDMDTYHSMYLTGASGNQDICMVLEELNAYTFTLYTEVNLNKHMPKKMKNTTRDGLGTFMLYLELYLKHARTEKQADYEKLKSDAAGLSIIKRLWENAEDALVKSIPCRNLGIYDRYKLKQVYDEANLSEIKSLFEGRSQGPALRGEIVTKFRLKAALAKNEIPNPKSSALKKGKSTTFFMIGGKKYDCNSLKAAAQSDPAMKSQYDALKSSNVCP